MANNANKDKQELSEELRELAQENRWYIENRWTVEEQQANAKRIADRLLAIAEGKTVEPVSNVASTSEFAGVVLPENFVPPEWLVKDESFPIVGRKFEQGEFIEYVKWVQKHETYSWSPSGITMHHTGFPDLSLRPNGFTEQHMLNMRHGYMTDRGWQRGPHIYTDDHAIWVFNPLSARGIHAVTYNSTRYGIEMLGNFDRTEDFESERGIASRANGMFAAAVLMKHAGISTAKLNFHRHDPETRKKCPGKLVNFSEFEDQVLAIVESV